MAPKPAGIAYLAAVLLAAITLFVFGTLRDYGPESAVRRFHDAVSHHDAADLAKVAIEPIDSSSVQTLVGWIGQLDKMSVSAPQLAAERREPNQVSEVTLFHLQYGQEAPIVWIVVRSTSGWKVNAQETVAASEALRAAPSTQ